MYEGREKGGTDGGIVGKIGDDFQITPTGQVAYNIPIPALPGTGGMKPCLSVNYSSSTKDGLLGYGFDLDGLSVISRTPADMFHDGMARAVTFTGYDSFSLDGQRLIPSSFGGSDYVTEINNFAKVTATYGNGVPKTFTVKTKSGLTYEYLPLSEALGAGTSANTLFWLVTKVTDTAGNYYKVTYDGDASENDFRVSRIDYTGNDNAELSPYASVRFTYTKNEYSPTTYVYSVPVHKSMVISSISLYYEEQKVRTFEFEYRTVNRKHLLSSVTERAADGTHKNPTRFTWATIDNFKVKNINYTHTGYIHKAKLTVGDFNGDGKADILATPQDKKAGWSGWKLFLSNGNGFVSASEGTWQWDDNEMEDVMCGDFNGDGCDDIIVKRCHSGKYYNCDLYLAANSGGNTSLAFSSSVLSLSTDFGMQPVEINGDGAADLFVWYNNSSTYELLRSAVDGNAVNPLSDTETVMEHSKWGHLEFGDFNGDGLTDILNLDKDGCRLLQSNGMGKLNLATVAIWPTSKHHIHTGDFNGDGKTDLLLTGYDDDPNSGGWSEWCIYYSLGNGSFKKSYHDKPFDARKTLLFVADINGDGFDDIHAVDSESSGDNMTRPKVYINDGLGNFYPQDSGCGVYAADKWRFYIGDFNGDGKTDFVCTSTWDKSYWDGYQLLVMPDGVNSLLTGIADGLGNRTDIHYKYLSDNSVYTSDKSCTYPLVSPGLSWPVVAAVDDVQSGGFTRTTEYCYSNAILHKAGRGLLGFGTFVATDKSTGISETCTYEANTDKYILGLKSRQSVWRGSKLLSESEYTNSLITLPQDSRVFVYTPTAVSEKTYEYNSGTLLSDSYTTTEYDSYGNVTANTTRTGDVVTVTESTYSNNTPDWMLGRLLSSTVTKSENGSEVSRSSTFEYDRVTGFLTSETFEPGNTALGYRKTYIHDKYGNVTESTTAPLDGTEPRTEKTGYDARGRLLVSSTSSLGFTTESAVDDVLGVVMKETDANGFTTEYRYDSFGQLVHTTTPIAETSKATGWCSGMEEAPEGAVYFEYSQSTGQPSSAVYYDSYGRTLRTVTDAPFGRKVYADIVYNVLGQVVKSSEPYFAGTSVLWNTNSYDAVGRTTVQTKPDGSTTRFSYDGLRNTVTDALGHSSYKTRDLNGRLVESVDAMGGYIHYKYDVDGNCIRVEGPRTTIVSEYDLAGHRTMLDDPDMGVSHDTYNAFGDLVQHSDSHGTTKYSYDRGGRLVRESRPDLTFTTTYDEGWKGAVSSVAADGSSKRYAYDGYGRVTGETTDVDGSTFVVQTSYNALGLPEHISYPAGLKVKRSYDANGFLTSVINADNKTVYWKLLAMNARGQVEQEQYGNGVVTTTAHDSITGNITAISAPRVQLSLAYTYDALGNVTARRSNRYGIAETFTYDALNRLERVDCNRHSAVTVVYDPAGNIVSKSDVGNYTYADGTNRLVAVDGNLKAWDEIRYNSLDKTVYVLSGSNVMSLCYGPDKSRIKANCNGVVKYYIGSLYEEKVNANKSRERTSYIFALGDNPIAMAVQNGRETDLYYFCRDLLGSTVCISDYRLAIIQVLDYDAWGRRRDPMTLAYNVWDVKDDHGFTGHEHIDMFDMVNMDGRIYDPVVGRFLSPDPFVQSPGFTQSLNRYAYCLNNPLSLVDPSGYSWLSRNWKSLVASAVGIVVSSVTLGTGTSVGIAIAAGATGGAAGALTGALLNGANLGQIAKATFWGGFWGAASGCLNNISADRDIIACIFKHAFTQGAIEGVQGGNVLHGVFAGAVSGLSGNYINKKTAMTKTYKLLASSLISGTMDEIGGGKFANGAVTGAFTFLFNDYMHYRRVRMRQRTKRMVQFVFDDKVGGASATVVLDSYITIEDFVHEKRMNLDINVVSFSWSEADLRGNFSAELQISDASYEYFLDRYKGTCFTPYKTNFSGIAYIKNVNYGNKHPINLTISGNWVHSSEGGRDTCAIIGTCLMIPAWTKQTFHIK